ncbi:conserved protein of unknown function [Acidithiobacillus ferrivorans]|uniref:Uncharacterized protein n=1 Tax=Acidithiobacillus ferrivorans TaxID=160808 RepID=A0A060UKI5_9PROT|nr:hypothetical protein AFERRI_110045 [Acidithiobacillus ferrivorans]SMH64200.1 conserved protein of unknown function [Acidithiobacillus ferrivorans]
MSMVTFSPRASSSAPRAAPAAPLPREETTPPVTKMYLLIGLAVRAFNLRMVANSDAGHNANHPSAVARAQFLLP